MEKALQKIGERYIKPKSLTWWASLVPIIGGLIIATEPLHGSGALVQSVRNIVGDGATAGVLINMGLAGVGIRGAID
ncbi:hypothetical protein ACMA5I_06580 [Paracoccaceae bacterium GXU_MW_L88]